MAVNRGRDEFSAIQPEALNGGQECGAFHNHFVARADHGFANEVERLLAARSHNKLFGRDALHTLVLHEMRKLLTERAIAFSGTILKCCTGFLRQGQGRGLANAFHIKHGAVGKTSGKADDAGLAQKFEQLPNG